ncbi:MAG TPA: DUF72 domain-containing protein [Planctomycetota bacterium]|nr:DUF72 domain-containing protein [Planctomycetota bacterium]
MLHIGIAGFSYEDWKGKVYPARGVDPLAFCARYVPLIEINSSFYRTPSPETVLDWVERTAPSGTRFTVKLGRLFTHERRLAPAEVAAFREALLPLSAAGRLCAVLAQFPFSFTAGARGRDWLARVVDTFAPSAHVAVEVRSATWQSDEALAFLRERGASLVHLDYPARPGWFDPAFPGIDDGGLAYFRLHGRNAEAWGRRDAERDELYDWNYSAAEVDDVVLRLREIVARARTTLVVANNHFEGKAMKLALELTAAVERRKVAVPELLLATYPDLARIASGAGQGRLFR